MSFFMLCDGVSHVTFKSFTVGNDRLESVIINQSLLISKSEEMKCAIKSISRITVQLPWMAGTSLWVELLLLAPCSMYVFF